MIGSEVSSSHYILLRSSEERTTLKYLGHVEVAEITIPPLPISRILPAGFAPFLVLIWYELIAYTCNLSALEIDSGSWNNTF